MMHRHASQLLAIAALTAAASRSYAVDLTPTTLLLHNPNWEIAISDFGYSDYLGDYTPGFEGREYLSGEWAGAVSYTVGTTHVTPTWLEPNFIYPDWTTNSNFHIVNNITPTVMAADGVSVLSAVSTIANSHLQIDIHYDMVDTVTGMKIGTTPASTATGAAIDSNRWVLKQTYTVTNISNENISGLNLFQFLHGLESTDITYDNHAYTSPSGTFADHHFDTTGRGESLYNVQATDGTFTTTTLRHYLCFGSAVQPSAYDSGRYGIDTIDSHTASKPSVGIHIAVENDALANNDHFADATNPYWVAGAQKLLMGNGALTPGASTSMDVVLSVKTGTVIGSTGSGGDSSNGGSAHPGGCDFHFENITKPGAFFTEFDVLDAQELAQHIAEGEFTQPSFAIPGQMQLFNLEFDGEYDGDVTLTLGYDPTALLEGFDPSLLRVYHYRHGVWQMENLISVDALNSTITITTSSLSPFVIGSAEAVPEPASLSFLALAGGGMVLRRRRP